MKARDSLPGGVRWGVLALTLTLLLFLSLPAGITASEPLLPLDPTADINWWDTGGEWEPDTDTYDADFGSVFGSVVDIAAAFDNGRATETTQRSISPPLPPLLMPSQGAWDAMSDNDKAVWLINQERAVRGVYPMEGAETNVTSVAQAYATYLVTNNQWGHYADGHDPVWRMSQNSTINGCNDDAMAECLAAFYTSDTSNPLTLERAIYNWIYHDSTASTPWGHRHIIMHDTYNDDACLDGQAGFLGMGLAGDDDYNPNGYEWCNRGDVVVLNVFDPCGDWADCGPTAVELASFVAAPGGGAGMLVGLAGVGLLVGLGVMVENRRRKR